MAEEPQRQVNKEEYDDVSTFIMFTVMTFNATDKPNGIGPRK